MVRKTVDFIKENNIKFIMSHEIDTYGKFAVN